MKELGWLVSSEETTCSKKKFVCGINGCTKSYSCRQNRYRHRTNDHGNCKTYTPSKRKEAPSKFLQPRERDLLMETFMRYIEQFGETEAIRAIRNHEGCEELLGPLREHLDIEITQRKMNGKESQLLIVKQASDLKNIKLVNSSTEAPIQFVLNLVQQDTPEAISFLQQFASLITSLIDHLTTYSEKRNPKLVHCRVLKTILDEMLDEEIRVVHTPLISRRKRTTECLAEAAIPMEDDNSIPSKKTRLSIHTVGMKESSGTNDCDIDNFLSSIDENEMLDLDYTIQ